MHEHPTGGLAPLDSSVAHPARVYNAWLGGRDDYLADQEAAEPAAASPQIVPAVRANSAFLGRAVRELTAQAGIRQFLDIGSHLVLSHPAADIDAEAVATSRRVYNERAADHAGATPRTHAEGTGFVAGTDLLAPGVVELPDWHSGPGDGPAPGLPMWCGAGRKP